MRYKIRYKWRMGVTVISEVAYAKSKRRMKIKVFFLRLFGNVIERVDEVDLDER